MRLNSVRLLCLFALFLLLLPGCAVLSREQLKAIDSFGTSCENFSNYPGALFSELAAIRMERGLFFASSIGEPRLRVSELNAIEAGASSDLSLSTKVNLSMEILAGYQRALKILAGSARWEDAGREFRSIGRNIDSLVIKYNVLEITEALPVGIAKAGGRLAGIMIQSFKKRSQAAAVKEFVVAADTLIAAIVSDMSDILSSPAVSALIENEDKGLEQDYISYLMSGKEDDRRYLELRARLNAVKKMRSGTISAAKRIAKAHTKIVDGLAKRRNVSELFDELLDLEKEVLTLRKEIAKI